MKPTRWAFVPGFHQKLEANDRGEIIRWLVRFKKRLNSVPAELERKQDAEGYNCICIGGHWLRVDHLIMRAFVGLEADHADVVHLNGELGDDRLENLKLVPWPEEDRPAP